MATTLLRLGLWLVVLVMALYVIHESYAEQPFVEMIPMEMLQHALAVAGVLIVAGVVTRVLDKGKAVVSKSRCRVCRAPVTAGAIYCRAHLHDVLEIEDRRTHSTRIR